MAFERVTGQGRANPNPMVVSYRPSGHYFSLSRAATAQFGIRPGGVEVLFDPETGRAALNFESATPTGKATAVQRAGVCFCSIGLAQRLGLNGAPAKFALTRDEETGLLVFGPDPLPAA